MARATGLVAWVLVVGLGGCRAVDRSAPPPPGESSDAAPSRVVATAPAIVETLYWLGLGERVVGVGDFAAWPPEVSEKPRIGGLFDPQLETIAALEPDLAILLVSERGLQEPLERLGVPVLLLEVESIADVEQATVAIAERMGVGERAESLLSDWRRELAPKSLAPRGAPKSLAPRVLLSIVRDPGRLSGVLTANRETFYQELLDRMGAVNLFEDAPIRYPQVSAEEIVSRNPTAVIELQAEEPDPAGARRLLADWASVPFPGAEPCLRVVAGTHTVLPGPRLPRLYHELRAALEDCGTGAGVDELER